MKQTLRYQGGHTLSYHDFGNPGGFPILIQHGLIASIDDTDLFACLAETGARLICIARPGYGASSPYEMKDIGEWGSIVSALVEALGLARFDVLGISSGAPYSYAIGYQLPDQVRNIFILSGTPALFDAEVLSVWPYPVKKDASIAEMEALAHDLFFAHLSPADLENKDITDSMMNAGFGIAQDFRLRCMDWGFPLSAVTANIIMRHSKADDSVPFRAAERTAQLLPNCRLDARDNDPHFSPAVLDDFIRTHIN